jgi:hypothetical protein
MSQKSLCLASFAIISLCQAAQLSPECGQSIWWLLPHDAYIFKNWLPVERPSCTINSLIRRWRSQIWYILTYLGELFDSAEKLTALQLEWSFVSVFPWFSSRFGANHGTCQAKTSLFLYHMNIIVLTHFNSWMGKIEANNNPDAV